MFLHHNTGLRGIQDFAETGRSPVWIATHFPEEYLPRVNAGPRAFWQTQPGLVWSNPNASDSVWLRRALLRPRFEQLLEIAVEFGLARLWEEWQALQGEGLPEIERARPLVERILRHIEEGFARASARN
jgi:hypothetical protein